MAAGVVIHGDVRARQVFWSMNWRLGRDVNARARYGISVAPHTAAPGGRGHVDGPVASGADFTCAAGLDRLERPGLCFDGQSFARFDARRPALDGSGHELIVEAFFAEVALIFSDPCLQPLMRLDAKFAHIARYCGTARRISRQYAISGGGDLQLLQQMGP